jgi:hypothetical protein
MQYEHTQRAPLSLMLLAIGVVIAGSAYAARNDPMAMYLLSASAGLMFCLGLMFGSLTVRDEGDCLRLYYGPIRVFQKQFAYSAIATVERARSGLIDGWGIHYVPGRGWIYNLWGRDCIKMLVDGHSVRIGTDDVENLVSFLQSRINSDYSPASKR